MKYLVLDWIPDGVGSYKEYFRDNWIMFQMNDLLDHFIVSMLTFLSVMLAGIVVPPAHAQFRQRSAPSGP